MGIFLNSAAPYSLYESEVKKPYFVDKSLMLEELFLPADWYHKTKTLWKNCDGKHGQCVF